jgi:hypothetical protein
MPKRQVDLRERFFSKTKRAENGCLEWTAVTRYGYGIFNRYPKLIIASRMAWIFEHGEIQDDLCVLHRCDNPKCVDHTHLFLGTRGDNHRDKVAKGRSNRGIKHGHSKLTDDQVRQIREMSGTQNEIAKMFGIDQGAVSRIRSRKAWIHI